MPDGFDFTDGDGARIYLELTENIPSGTEVGLIAPTDSGWFVVFTYADDGYINDDEVLDADAILESLIAGNQAANVQRESLGWGTLDLVGWEVAPYYDPSTNNLTWATRVRTNGEVGPEDFINHSVRLLGRGGVVSAELVYLPDDQSTATASFSTMVAGFGFNEGQRYAEFREGDRVANYGLMALIAGGAGAVAAKTGLLAFLGKSWKFLVAGLVALFAALRALVGRFSGRDSTDTVPGQL